MIPDFKTLILITFIVTHCIVMLPQNKKFDFKNATYKFDNGEYKFINGEWNDEELMATVSLESITPIDFIGFKNSYMLYFSGNWGGGNSFWGEILIVYIDNNKLQYIQNLSIASTDTPPRIENKNLILTSFMWLDIDSHCCPNYKYISTMVWDGKNFFEKSLKKIKTEHWEAWEEKNKIA